MGLFDAVVEGVSVKAEPFVAPRLLVKRSWNAAASLYSPFNNSGIFNQLKQGAEVVSLCDLRKPKLCLG